MELGKCMALMAMIMILSLLFLCCSLNRVHGIQSISSSQFIKDPESIMSANNFFEFGFFTPSNSTYRYVGIWYSNVSALSPTWVANRDRPLTDDSGTVRVSDDGNLLVLNGRNEVLWSSNVSDVVGKASAQLTDDGNLVLQDTSNNKSIWESFQHPSDTLLSKMRLTSNRGTGEKELLTSWTSPWNPAVGSFFAGIYPLSIPEFVVWNGSNIYMRSGPWNGQVFNGFPQVSSYSPDGISLEQDGDGYFVLYYTYDEDSPQFNFFLNYDGKLLQRYWDASNESWIHDFTFPSTECDVYRTCGAFGSCNTEDSPICNCLTGFEPKKPDEWSRGNWAEGCIRKKQLQCERVRNGSSSSRNMGKEDGFLKLEMVKVPDFSLWSTANEQKCRDNCLSNCSCTAYGYYMGIGCLSWTQELIDIQQFPSGGADLYIRLEYSEFENKKGAAIPIKLIISLVVAVSTFVICTYILWKRMARYRDQRKRRARNMLSSRIDGVCTGLHNGNGLEDGKNQLKFQDLPIFDMQMLAKATDDFNATNKLGQGGFGPVYKGTLPDGREIAVKRLSTVSGQGVEELLNEVLVISNLQHRNLVRLFGCCVEDEKLLVYEYMPNRSLDSFLFDPVKKSALDWTRRFNIIQGICRGLVYLHRDSRLRIIHRDLKASNILLDKELTAKISDFGMARIFGGNEDEANTKRVVGTYGYMSPEYVIRGQFSKKSDVFSFGVLLLEIVTGRRNTSFHDNDEALNLLEYVWKPWNEDNLSDIIEPIIFESRFKEEIFRCIHVGLLCVQESGRDRPDASAVISMLNSEIQDLPAPKKPAFTDTQIDFPGRTLQQKQKTRSNNNATITTLDGR